MDFIKFKKISKLIKKNPTDNPKTLIETQGPIKKETSSLKKDNKQTQVSNKNQFNNSSNLIAGLISNIEIENLNQKFMNRTIINDTTSNNELEEILRNRNRRISIRDNVKYFESQMEERAKLKHDSSLLGIAKKYGYDGKDKSLEECLKNPETKEFSFLKEIQTLIDEYESKLNTANLKINEILKENHNLKGKIKSIEDSSTKECESLKKSLVESLEKIKILEKKKDDDSRKSNLKNNLQSNCNNKVNHSFSYNLYDESSMELKILKYEEKIEKLVIHNEKLLDGMSVIEDLKLKLLNLEKENKLIQEKNELLKHFEEKYKSLQIENDYIIKENLSLNIKIIDENKNIYFIEEQLSDLKNRMKTEGGFNISELLEQSQERQRNLETENMEIKEKILMKEDLINELTMKYSDYNKHLTQICEGLFQTTTPIQSNQTNKIFNDEFVIDLIVSEIFNTFLLENSINLNKINKKICGNYNYFLNTIFLANEDTKACVSIIHEYLEDVFFRIYNFYLKRIFKTKDIKYKSEIWEIYGHDITDDDINLIAHDIFSHNNLSLLFKFINLNDFPSIDIIKSKLCEKYKHYFKDENYLLDLVNKNDKVNEKLNSNLLKHKEISVSHIKELVYLCKNKIFSGKIVHKDYQIYNFKKFYIEYLNLEKLDLESSYNFINNLDSQDTIDHLTNSIKYRQSPLKSFSIDTNINGKINFPLTKLIQCILLYNSELSYFSLTDASLINKQFLQVIKLVNFSSLEILDLSNNKLGDANINLLSEALKFNDSLKILYLSNNDITSAGGSYLSEVFKDNKSIEKLNLGGNKISDTGLSKMITSISMNNNIKLIDISDNKISHKDLLYLSNHLVMKNQTIHILNLSFNKFDAESVNLLGLSLKNNNTLKILYLNSVSFNEDSSPYLFQHLASAKLSEIHLDNNYLGEIGGILCANVLKHNIYIKIISMKKCELNSMSLHCIAKAFEVNDSLRFMNLEENIFNDQSLLTVKKTIDTRSIKISLSSSFMSPNSLAIIKQKDKYNKLNPILYSYYFDPKQFIIQNIIHKMNEKIYYLSFIFFIFSINCEKIKIFKDANFETVLSFQNNTLFLFSNSDCNFCEQMKIAFKESFRLNQVIKMSLTYGKVDVKKNPKIFSKYKVSNLPSVKLVMKDGNVMDYKGIANSTELTNWLRKKLFSQVNTFKKVKEVLSFVQNNENCLIYFGKKSSSFFKIYNKISEEFPHVEFLQCSSSECLSEYKIKSPSSLILSKLKGKNSVIIAKVENEEIFKYELSMNFQSELIKFDFQAANDIFSEGYPSMILYRNPNEDKNNYLEDIMINLAKILRGKIKVVISDITSDIERDFANMVGVWKEDLPTIRIFDSREILKKYKYTDPEITLDKAYGFYLDWHSNKLNPYVRSEKEETYTAGNLFKITGNNYHDVISNKNNNVVVLYYKNNDEKSKKVFNIFKILANMAKNNKKFIIGTLELVKNEIEFNDYDKLPLVRLYQEGKINNYLDFNESEITLNKIKMFVGRHTKFEVNNVKNDL